MKNLFTVCLLFIGTIGLAQTLSLTSPSGLTPPYEVASGTVVTVEWDYFDSEPTYMFTYDQDPGSNLDSDWQFSINSDWTSGSGWTDNGDGTYSWEVTITEDTWIFGAYNAFMGNAYSNVINVNLASGIIIEFEDGLICSTGDTETLSVLGTHTSYQWYMDSVLISGATEANYEATEAGTYYAIVDGTQSNFLTIENLSIAYTGTLNTAGTELTLTANAGMDSYQWYSGTDESSMTAISGATSAEYVATLSTVLTYYHVVGTLDICDVTSENNSANLAMFIPVVVNVNADTNSYNKVCEGTTITVSIDPSTENFTWYKNGTSNSYSTPYINITGTWAAGDYHVMVSPAEWPEIEIQSNTIDASYYELIDPILFGEDNNSLHCAGEDIIIDLADEGYNYSWYAHESYSYNDTDIVDVPGTSYSFTFESSVRVTVVGEFQGCEASSSLNLPGYESQSIYVSITNYSQQYLCTDSVANIALASYTAVNYTDFQWFHKDGDDWDEIVGADTSFYAAPDSGYYKLRATSINCPTAILESNEYHVRNYQERSLNLYVNQAEMCLGDTATLNIYSSAWSNIQWLEGDIQMGDSGYEMFFVPISGAGNESSQEVYEFNRYIVKAKHNSCPNGLKTTSNEKIVKPSVNPEVIVDMDIYSHRLALWDSAIFYLDCIGNNITLTIEDNYDSYQWYEEGYAGLDDYIIGDPIDGETSAAITAEVAVQWLTAEVSLDGCIGYTDPILLDGWAFLDPAVASYNNNQICEGDSALVNLGFPGTWIEYYWTLDGVEIEDSNNDSLWVTEPGQYVIFAYPADCPTALFTSGVGPTLQILEALILEDVDDEGNAFFYAWPWQGDFEFQWYLNGEPIDGDTDIPAILWKTGLGAGEITVEIINNGDGCIDLSEIYMWDPSVGIDENNFSLISIYPNPSNGIINITGLVPFEINSARLYNAAGKIVMNISIESETQRVDISDLPKGMYLLRIQMNDGALHTQTVNKL